MELSIQELFTLHLGDPRPAVRLPSDLAEPYHLELVHRYEEPLFTELVHTIFHATAGSFRWRELGLDEDLELRAFRRAQLQPMPRLRVAARCGEELVGWSYAFGDRPDSLYMASSAVLPRHRRKGLYRAMVRAVIDLARQAGFHAVHSKHIATNNPILLAKLALGFYVTGTELSPEIGSLVRLEKPLVELRERALLARSGQMKLTPAMGAAITESLPVDDGRG